MILGTLWESIQASALGDYIATSDWAFPTIETIHVIAITTVFGTIAVMDLRLLGLASGTVPVTIVSRDTIRFTWAAFVVAAITGTLMWVSKTTNYMANPYFYAKMIFMALAGVNMLVMNIVTMKTVSHWDTSTEIPTAAKIGGALSLAFWIAVVFCGRVIGFTLGIYW